MSDMAQVRPRAYWAGACAPGEGHSLGDGGPWLRSTGPLDRGVRMGKLFAALGVGKVEGPAQVPTKSLHALSIFQS